MKASHANLDESMGFVKRGGFAVIGVSAEFDPEDIGGVPELWPRLLSALPLAGQIGKATYGVMWRNDWTAPRMSYLAGVEAAVDALPPDGFDHKRLAPQTYLGFRLTLDGGPLHPQMREAMSEIWGALLPKAGVKVRAAPALEIYPADFEPLRKGARLDIWVPVDEPAASPINDADPPSEGALGRS